MLSKRMIAVMALCLSGCGREIVSGHDGINGVDGKNGVAGAPGINGTNGTNGINGTDGKDGTNGVNGKDGTQGPPGLNGTSITTVAFCPGYAPVYPSVFPEVGLCINDSIFAVYSANDGFLALIPPGRYSSDGIGSACTFTVSAHCKVSW